MADQATLDKFMKVATHFRQMIENADRSKLPIELKTSQVKVLQFTAMKTSTNLAVGPPMAPWLKFD